MPDAGVSLKNNNAKPIKLVAKSMARKATSIPKRM